MVLLFCISLCLFLLKDLVGNANCNLIRGHRTFLVRKENEYLIKKDTVFRHVLCIINVFSDSKDLRYLHKWFSNFRASRYHWGHGFASPTLRDSHCAGSLEWGSVITPLTSSPGKSSAACLRKHLETLPFGIIDLFSSCGFSASYATRSFLFCYFCL